MPDTTSTTTQQDQKNQPEGRPQTSYDNSFFEQMGGPSGVSPASLGYDVTSQVLQSYFETIEAQTRQARRMADLWAQSLILQQTTNQIAQVVAPVVTKQVIAHLQQNPEWAKRLISS